MAEEWGPWTEHDGKGCPLSRGVVYETKTPCGCGLVSIVDDIDINGIDWLPSPEGRVCNQCDADFPAGLPAVISYRIRKPRGMTILEGILADLPANPVVPGNAPACPVGPAPAATTPAASVVGGFLGVSNG